MAVLPTIPPKIARAVERAKRALGGVSVDKLGTLGTEGSQELSSLILTAYAAAHPDLLSKVDELAWAVRWQVRAQTIPGSAGRARYAPGTHDAGGATFTLSVPVRSNTEAIRQGYLVLANLLADYSVDVVRYNGRVVGHTIEQRAKELAELLGQF